MLDRKLLMEDLGLAEGLGGGGDLLPESVLFSFLHFRYAVFRLIPDICKFGEFNGTFVGIWLSVLIFKNIIKFATNKLLVKSLVFNLIGVFDLVESIDYLLIVLLLGYPEELLIKLCEFLKYCL